MQVYNRRWFAFEMMIHSRWTMNTNMVGSDMNEICEWNEFWEREYEWNGWNLWTITSCNQLKKANRSVTHSWKLLVIVLTNILWLNIPNLTRHTRPSQAVQTEAFHHQNKSFSLRRSQKSNRSDKQIKTTNCKYSTQWRNHIVHTDTQLLLSPPEC